MYILRAIPCEIHFPLSMFDRIIHRGSINYNFVKLVLILVLVCHMKVTQHTRCLRKKYAVADY